MGRRLLLILGVILSLSWSGRIARGQDDDRKLPPPEPAPYALPVPPATFPSDLEPPEMAPGSDTDRPEARITGGTGEQKARDPAAGDGARKSDEPSTSKTTAKNVGAAEGKSKTGEPAWKRNPARGRSDESVIRTQAPAPAAATGSGPPDAPVPVTAPGGGGGGAAAASDASRAAVDRLPIGKQSVAVTVDVQAPASMNLKQEATLKLIVRNSGVSDALNVDVQDELPEGLQYISSQPEMHVTGDSHLSLRINTLPAGSDRVITIRVKPNQTGPFDHAATVRFETGCKSRTLVREPRLKVDVVANPTVGKVLKGQSVEFKVNVTNTGDGPARNVAIQAKLTTGLRHESGPRGEEQMLYELTLPELMPGQTERLDSLVAEAISGGDQGCTVIAKSPDVVFNKDDAEVTKTVAVVEPKVKVALKGPDSRYTDTVGDYEISLENPGSAPARKIRLLVTLPVTGRLVKVPPEARYDSTTRKLYWTVDQIEAKSKALTFPFQVRMGGKGHYEIRADATGDGGLSGWDRRTTEVVGMPDVDLVVSEPKRVLDVGGTTQFVIRLRNYGTEDATNLQVMATLSKNLQAETAGGGSKDVIPKISPTKDQVVFEQISKLGPNKEMVLGILVRVVGEEPRLATCKVFVTHDDLPDRFEDMAAVKVTTVRRAAAGPGGAGPK